MPARPIAKRVWSGSTSTGTQTVFFGVGQRFVSAYISNGSTKAFVNKVEGTIGNSTVWAQLLPNATSTGANVVRTSTDGMVFDKVRFNVSENATTGVAKVWLGVSV